MSKLFKSASVLALFVLIGVAAPVGAQTLTVAYQDQHLSCSDCDGVNYPLGLSLDISGPIKAVNNLGWVGQVDWSRHSESGFTDNVTAFGGGVRWSKMVSPKATPFVQALVGAAHDSSEGFSETKGMFELDGGVAVPLSGKLSGVGEVGYRRIFTEGEGTNAIRIVVGVRWDLK